MAVSKFGLRDWMLGWLVPSGTNTAAIQGVANVDSSGNEYTTANPFPVALQASPVSAAFNPTGEATLSVTNASARVGFGSVGPTAFIVNTGANIAYVKFGNASVVSDTTSGYPIPSGWAISFDVTGSSFVAAITASSTASLTITTGTGVVSVAASGSAAAAGESVNLASVGGAAIAIGQAAMAASLPVVIASNQSTLTTQMAGWSFQNITTSTTTTVKSGAGVLHIVNVNTLGTVASTTTVYDNTAGSGTKIATINSLTLSGPFQYDIAFATGLTLVTTGTAAPDITVSYR